MDKEKKKRLYYSEARHKRYMKNRKKNLKDANRYYKEHREQAKKASSLYYYQNRERVIQRITERRKELRQKETKGQKSA